MLRAFIVRMIRVEAIDPDDIAAAADDLDAQGDAEAAHSLRCMILHASAQPASEFQAEQRRRQIRLVDDVPKGSD